ncbi:MAG: glutamate--tRNA ligase [Candidatus Nealsonbacteria bacterium]|nr:glutamate--tRNA ligase [Candidatus Nealsonbacteria bacterium]
MALKSKEIRVRMAPSPTGLLHFGNARTALFNYLFTKHSGGKLILRIEDTDIERSDKAFEKDIIDNLKWLGIIWDEGPFLQSERTSIYIKYLDKLVKDGLAYYCFCTQEELEGKKQEQMSRGVPAKYNGKCHNLSEEEIKKYLSQGKPSVIRFKIPEKKVSFNDIIRGKIEFESSLLGDFVIAKDLSTPLYNFALVVDDFEMKISHVIRGEDHIPNTPKQILLQEALNLPQPKYGHLPLILGPDKSKLSKRHGTQSIAEYRKQGYLAESVINFMAFLGWNPGTEKEIFSMDSLIKEFSLEKVQKSGAIFNIQRLDYLNGFYIRQKSIDELTELCQPYLPASPAGGPKIDKQKLQQIIAMHKERLKKLSEIKELTDFFFKQPQYSKELLRWKKADDEQIKQSLDILEKLLFKIKRWDKAEIENVLMVEAEQTGDRGILLWPFRVALSGKKASAGPFEIAEALGKEETLIRIKQAKELIL